MSKVRINDLARELEVKSRAILDVLEEVGVSEKKTHSSSLEEHEAEKVRIKLRSSSDGQTVASRSSRAPRAEEGIKTKIDLSNISRPGDVLKAITQRQEAATAPSARAGISAPPMNRPVAVPPAKPSSAPAAPSGSATPVTVAPPAAPAPPVRPPAMILPQ